MIESCTGTRSAHLGGGGTEGVGGLLRVPCLHPLATTVAAADAEVEPGGDRAHRGKVDLELAGGPLQLEITAAVRAARRQRHIDLPLRNAGRSHAVAVATVGVPAAPSRLCRLLLRVSLGERGCLTLARAAGLRQEPFQLGDAGVALAETLVQLGELGGVGLEPLSQMGELADQLLVGAGICARGSVVSRNSPRYARLLLRWWTPLSKYAS